MRFPSIKNLFRSIKDTLVRFPFEISFALIGTIAATAFAKGHNNGSIYSINCIRIIMVANLGLLLSLANSLYIKSKNINGYKQLLIKIAVTAIGVSFFVLINPFEREYDTLRFFMLSFALHLLVAYAAFTQKGQIQGFWQFNKTLFLRFLAGMLYSGVLYLGLLAAILSTKYLFNIHWSDDTYFILWIWIVGIFNTVFFLAGVPFNFSALDEDISYPKGLKIFTQYVLIPLATVYVIILLAYEIKILIEWRLPKGYVSNLILGYSVFGMLSILLVYPIRDHVENKWLKIYARSFYFLLLPLIVLLFLAMLARVLPYGITPQRYLLLILTVWLLFITLYFLLLKRQSIKIIPLSLCIITLFSTYGPQSAFSISMYSQKHMLIDFFKKYNAFSDEHFHSVKHLKVSRKDGSNAINKISFIVQNGDLDEFRFYINANLNQVKDSLLKARADSGVNRYTSRYNLYLDKAEWVKKYLGLENFYESEEDYRYDNKQHIITYEFDAKTDKLLNIKGYDYAIRVANDYNRADTSIYQTENIYFVSVVNSGNRSLSINGELAKFDIKSVAEKLVNPSGKLKDYKETDGNYPNSGYKAYTLRNDSLITVIKQTNHYLVVFKISTLSFEYSLNDKANITNIEGYYLIKKKL